MSGKETVPCGFITIIFFSQGIVLGTPDLFKIVIVPERFISELPAFAVTKPRPSCVSFNVPPFTVTIGCLSKSLFAKKIKKPKPQLKVNDRKFYQSSELHLLRFLPFLHAPI